MFLAIDGIDGAGKTTIVRQLAELLGPLDPVVTKEPTDISHWGRRLREAAVNGRLTHDQEIEYFHKDRVNHIQHVIQPSLKEGRAVITDRYVDSTLAFQAHSPEEADALYERFLPDIKVPDISFILKCPVEIGIERIRMRNGNEGFSTFEVHDVLVRAQKIYESRRGPNYEMIDAGGSIEDTFCQAFNALKRRFSEEKEILDIIGKSDCLCDIYQDSHLR